MERVPPQGAPGACRGPCFCVVFAFLAWPCTGSPKVPSGFLPCTTVCGESIKNTNSDNIIGVKSIRPTWFEDIVTSREPQPQTGQTEHEPMHGLKLVIKEEALPLKEQPEFPALAELAKRGLLAPDTWSCKRTQISLKVTIDVPMLGTIIEQNGDGLLEQSHMPAGWPLHTREAPTPSPKIISISGTKNEPKTNPLYLLVLVMTIFPFLFC